VEEIDQWAVRSRLFRCSVQLPDIDIPTTKVSEKGDCAGHNRKLSVSAVSRMDGTSTNGTGS